MVDELGCQSAGFIICLEDGFDVRILYEWTVFHTSCHYVCNLVKSYATSFAAFIMQAMFPPLARDSYASPKAGNLFKSGW